ncbi:hypothetical protein TU82_04370 [Pseudomonas orientalis]|nr:hypothetical protein TU82_04370 [Pseudomonas orientalis]
MTLKTDGLKTRFGYEISVTINTPNLQEEAVKFIELVTRHLESGFKLASDETLGYGCWITKMHLNNRQELMFFEQAPRTETYVPGINTTLQLWAEQHMICAKNGVDYVAPSFEQMIIISHGVMEGDPAEGVRYPSPEHMSGWWITTDRYDGNTENLQSVHLQHVAVNRPDLVKYLGLPFGYRFHGPSNDVWLDEKIK